MTLEEGADESPFVTIWESPRATIRRIVARDPRRSVNALFFAAGVIGALEAISRLSEGRGVPLAVVPIGCLAFGALSVPFSHLNAWYKRWIGSLLGGSATHTEVAAVNAWSTVPSSVGHGAIWLVQLVLYGTEAFAAERPSIDASPRLLQLSLGFGGGAFSIWSFVIAIVGFAEVNRFSLARSIAASLLASLIIAIVGIVLALAAIATLGLQRFT